MMKIVALLLGLSVLFAGYAVAENDFSFLNTYSDEELLAIQQAVLAEMETRDQIIIYEILEKGSQGDAVVDLQKRLIELNYLSTSADGDYGNKTKAAVELFQTEAGLKKTGIADAETQKLLFSKDAPRAKIYQSLNYDAISRDPESHTGNLYQFSGKVVQVMEQKQDDFTWVSLRIATKGRYDNVVYVNYLREDGEARILEDDRVNVKGDCLGLYTYETVMGSSVTIPHFFADSIEVK